AEASLWNALAASGATTEAGGSLAWACLGAAARGFDWLNRRLGLGRYEGRNWLGWHHHAALVFAAYGFLVSEMLAPRPDGVGRLSGRPDLPAPRSVVTLSASEKRKSREGACHAPTASKDGSPASSSSAKRRPAGRGAAVGPRSAPMRSGRP